MAAASVAIPGASVALAEDVAVLVSGTRSTRTIGKLAPVLPLVVWQVDGRVSAGYHRDTRTPAGRHGRNPSRNIPDLGGNVHEVGDVVFLPNLLPIRLTIVALEPYRKNEILPWPSKRNDLGRHRESWLSRCRGSWEGDWSRHRGDWLCRCWSDGTSRWDRDQHRRNWHRRCWRRSGCDWRSSWPSSLDSVLLGSLGGCQLGGNALVALLDSNGGSSAVCGRDIARKRPRQRCVLLQDWAGLVGTLDRKPGRSGFCLDCDGFVDKHTPGWRDQRSILAQSYSIGRHGCKSTRDRERDRSHC